MSRRPKTIMMEFDWEQTYWNNSVADYAFVLGYSIGVTLVIFLLLKVMVWRLKRPAEAGHLPMYLAWQALQSTRVWLSPHFLRRPLQPGIAPAGLSVAQDLLRDPRDGADPPLGKPGADVVG